MPPRNVLVAQSGGPSPVINASLLGVIDGCRSRPGVFGRIFGGWHGIEGVLKEELLDLSAQPEEEIRLLRTTPAAGSIGTCRYKLKPSQAEDFERVVEVLRAHDIGFFFYNGGNDSMDTAHKVAQLAAERGLDLVATGVPKTIDNDVGDSGFQLIDHTPGYGSTARYWAQYIRCAEEENRGSSPSDPVLVLQAMGRRIGYIPAAARLADPAREMPLRIFMAEAGWTMEGIESVVVECLREHGRCIAVVSEGLDVGEIGAVKDNFGHTVFSASKMAAAALVAARLNEAKLPVPGKARYQIPGTDQRNAIAYASTVDLEEAWRSGFKAAEIAATDGNGWMATILRRPGPIYGVDYDKVPLELVANSERAFPAQWLSKERWDVTDDFVAYARPLLGEDQVSVPVVGGLFRFARLQPLFAGQKLPAYTPQTYR